MSDPALIGEVERYYSDKVARHGPTPLGVDWNDAAGQNLRFERLLRVLDGAGPPVLDQRLRLRLRRARRRVGAARRAFLLPRLRRVGVNGRRRPPPLRGSR